MKKIYIAQAVQFLLLLLFVFLVYAQEKVVLNEITNNYAPWLIDQLKQNLHSVKKIYQPAEFWRFLWPFLCVFLSLLLPRRVRWYFLGFIGIISSVYLVANRIYDSFFTSVISVHSFTAVPFLWSVKDSVTSSLSAQDLLYLFSFSVFVIYGFVYNRFLHTDQNKQAILLDLLLTAVFLLLTFQSWQVAFHYYFHPDMEIIRSKQEGVPFFEASDKGFACGFGLFNFLLMDASRNIYAAINAQERIIDKEDLQIVTRELTNIKKINDIKTPLYGIAKDRNVILISLESFSTGFVDLKAGETEISPTINKLKKQGLYWENVMSSITRGGSSDAEFSILTGLMADRRKITVMEYPRSRAFVYLPELLKREGYRTISMHGNNASFWARDVNHPIFGIDNLFFKNKFTQDIHQLGVSDRTFFNESADILLDQSQPFFAYLIALSSHHPFEVPESHRNLKVGLPAESSSAKLLQGTRYTDDALGQFIAKLKKTSLWKKSVIIIFGDHPVTLEKSSTIKDKFGIDLLGIREQRTPLIILIPGKEAELAEHRNKDSAVVSGLHDLFPTVLHLLGKEIPFGVFGIHQFIPNQQRVVLPWYNINNGYIHNGTIYVGSQGYTLKDNQGVLLLGDSNLVSPEERLKNFKQAYLYLKLHEAIFDFDAQKLAIKDYQLEQ